MLGSLAVLALLTTINPVRIGIVLLVLTRPRPMRNLLAYWVGAVIVGLFALIVPLIVLHSATSSASFSKILARPPRTPPPSALQSASVYSADDRRPHGGAVVAARPIPPGIRRRRSPAKEEAEHQHKEVDVGCLNRLHHVDHRAVGSRRG